MAVNIIFEQAFPNNFRTWAERLIRKYELLFPVWVRDVRVFWEEGTDAYAAMSINDDYREVKIKIDRSLTVQPTSFQEETMLHEITHSYTNPLYAVALEVLNRMFPDGESAESPELQELYYMWSEKIRACCERSNSDFTYALDRYIKAAEGGDER